MTGGQMAPTTIAGEITDTTPYGRKVESQGEPFHGPEMIACINKKAYIARGTISNPIQLKFFIKKAIEHQIAGKGFAFVEAISNCPVNWKTLAKETWERTQELEKVFKVGEIQSP